MPRPPSQPLNVSQHQLKILSAIRSFAAKHGYVPSVRELARQVKRSSTTVFQHLRALRAKGFLAGTGTAHGWQLVTPRSRASAATWTIAIDGTVAAGTPHRDRPKHPATLTLGAQDTYALLVRGHSMVSENILDGDVVLVRKSPRRRADAIVVTAAGDGSRRLVRLKRSPRKRSQTVARDAVLGRDEVLGNVVGVVRRIP